MRIRDPIHGTIYVSDEEKAVLDSRFFQRLRHVRQLGFGDLAFPGATHTRHAHCLGAMHLASRLFDAVARRAELAPGPRERLRAAVRLALLCHDLGHMPLSHASESIAPPRAALGLPSWVSPATSTAQSAHEDFTAKILLDSELTQEVREAYAPLGLTPESIVSLVTGSEAPAALRGEGFLHEGVDWTPLLRALVSGELDADRMDYLLRDSFYTGVNYGRYDLDWIVGNLDLAVKDGRAFLALDRSAAFAFEDFLLSRYHMFVSVYYHHTTVAFDYMLQRFYEESSGEFQIPSQPEAFVECDDVALAMALRGSKNPWAQRIVARRGFKLLAQFTERDEAYDLEALAAALTEAKLEFFSVESQGVLSRYAEASREAGTNEGELHDGTGQRYHGKKLAPSLFIIDVPSGRLTEVERYIPLYQRYSGAVRLSRIYVRPDLIEAAERLLEKETT